MHLRKIVTIQFALLLLIFGPFEASMAEQQSGPFLVLIGAPASGKTSIGKYVSEQYGVPNIDVLKVLQDEMTKAVETKAPPGKPGSRRSNAWSERNRSIKGAMKKLENGELVKGDVINSSVLMRLMEEDCRNGFILDGYPGTVEQAIFLDGLLSARGVDSLQVVLLDVTDEFALEKMAKRGRPHDTGGFAETRLKLFRENIGPVLDYYQGETLHVVDATRPKAEMRAEVDSILE